MRKKYFPLSEKGIKDAISYLESYKEELIEKTKFLLEELSKVGIKEADSRIRAAKGETTDKSHAYVKSVEFDGKNVTMNIEVQGEDIVFIEYGAGVYYNRVKAGQSAHVSPTFRDAHPDFLIGKYGTDGSKQYSLGAHDSWHYNHTVTHGTEATMPVYGAIQKMTYEAYFGNIVRKAFAKWS